MAIRAPFASDRLGQKGLPEGGARPVQAGLQEETEAVSGFGQEEGYAGQSREEDRALTSPWGEAWGPGRGLRETVQPGRERERGEAWDREGPGGGSHADKPRDKLISSVYPGAGASSPAALLPFLSLAPE